MTRVQKNGDICHSPALKYAFLVNQLPELVVRDALKIGRHDDGRSKLTPMSQNTNDRGWFVVVKTRLTTKRKRECEKRGDYIYIVRG
jgi:hypothetical protein